MSFLRIKLFLSSALAVVSCGSAAGSSSGATSVGGGATAASGSSGITSSTGSGGEADSTSAATGTTGAGGEGGSRPQCGPKASFGFVATLDDASRALVYADGFVYATDESGSELVVVDATTDKVVAQVPTGKGPRHLAAGKGLVFVLDALAEQPQDEMVTVVDTSKQARVGGASLPSQNGHLASFPADLTFFENLVYVTNSTFETPSVFPIELQGFQTTGAFPAGKGPTGIAGSSGYLFVINENDPMDPADDALFVLKADGTYVGVIATGGALQDIVTAPDGRVFVTRTSTTPGASRVLAVDPTSFTVKEINVGDDPSGLAVQGSRVYTANQGGPSVTIIDTANGDATTELDLSSMTPALVNLRGIAVAPCEKIYLRADGGVALLQP